MGRLGPLKYFDKVNLMNQVEKLLKDRTGRTDPLRICNAVGRWPGEFHIWINYIVRLEQLQSDVQMRGWCSDARMFVFNGSLYPPSLDPLCLDASIPGPWIRERENALGVEGSF